jgi:hypothetical protein
VEFFEKFYRAFMAAGGFSLPAIAEDWERDAREPREGHQPVKCPHGKTVLTCSDCYFGRS